MVTSAMLNLRRADFVTRQRAYLTGRTLSQHSWYHRKAQTHRRSANSWRLILLVTEAFALALAGMQLSGHWRIEWTGILAACVASGAAWLSFRQHDPLAAAYSTASKELALQAPLVEHARDQDWEGLVADCEEAISREHTMWLASRDHDLA